MSDCEECGDEHYILIGCCSGYMCGCYGQPVLMTNCDTCNPDGNKPLGNYVKQFYEKVEYIGAGLNKEDSL